MAAEDISLVVPLETTNLCTNPSFETGTTGWAAISGAALSAQLTYQTHGRYSLRIIPTAAVNDGARYNLTTGAGVISFSCHVRGFTAIPYRIWIGDAGGALVPGTEVDFIGDGAWHRYQTHYHHGGGAFYLCISKNGSADTSMVYVDSVQCESFTTETYTTYCDGDQPGCEWLGVAHASKSRRSGQWRGGGEIITLASLDIEVKEKAGLGMPPNKQNARAYALLPGAEMRSVKIESRPVTLTCLAGGTEAELNETRQDLVDILKPDVVAKMAPFLMRYEGASQEAELECYYDSGLERSVSTAAIETFPLRVIAHDPFFRAVVEQTATLDTNDTATLRYVAARLRSTGKWSGQGLGANPLANGTVYAIAVNPFNQDEVYYGGDFTGWNGVAGRNYLVRYRRSTNAWEAVGAVNIGGIVYCLAFGPNGILYIGGAFLNGGGDVNADYFAQYDSSTDTISAVGGVATNGNGIVQSVAIGEDEKIYIGGAFTNWALVANADYFACWDGGAWTSLGAGGTGAVYAIAVDWAGNVWIGGTFANWAGVANADKIAVWDIATTAWKSPGDLAGANGDVNALAIGPDGTVYAAGGFTTLAGIAAVGIGRWNGTIWESVGTGLASTAKALAIAPDGSIYAGCVPTIGGGPIPADYATRWYGAEWARLDVLLPGTPTVYAVAIGWPDPADDGIFDLYLGFDQTGTGQLAGSVTVTNAGSATAYPIIRIAKSGSGTGLLVEIRNETTGKSLLFELVMMNGEELIIDLTPNRRHITSNFRGNLLKEILSGSDLTAWGLQSGANVITAFVGTSGAPPTVTAYILWRNTYWSIDSL